MADIERLLVSLNQLVDAGRTVIPIEHYMDVVKTADHVIDLGPEGGHAGGEVVVTGAPEDVRAARVGHRAVSQAPPEGANHRLAMVAHVHGDNPPIDAEYSTLPVLVIKDELSVQFEIAR